MSRFVKGIVFTAALIVPAVAQAQSRCADRDTVISKLESSYDEAFAGGGLQSSNSIFEVWFSEAKGTWTILMTRADGMSCVMASGTNWREALPAMKKPAGIPG